MSQELRKWAVGVITLVALTFAAWTGSSIISLWQKMSAAEANVMEIYRWLERVESKLDRALERH